MFGDSVVAYFRIWFCFLTAESTPNEVKTNFFRENWMKTFSEWIELISFALERYFL